MLKRFLFPTNPNGVFISVILLVVRIVFGIRYSDDESRY